MQGTETRNDMTHDMTPIRWGRTVFRKGYCTRLNQDLPP